MPTADPALSRPARDSTMITAASEGDSADKFELELYKILKSESASYFEKLQAIWLQKFVLVGGLIAFLVTQHDKLPLEGDTLIISAAVLAVPVLSALLDAKILEFSLHTRAISRFIESHFLMPSTLSSWERVLWGIEELSDDHKIVYLRSLTTTLVTIVPTMIIWLLASITLVQLTGLGILWLALGVLGCLTYALITWMSWRVLWRGAQ
jgi:hypothetical protein